MKHIVSFSGGKDSTAMLLKMLESKMCIDYIVFCDTGMEFPQMYDHIEMVNKFIKEKYNKKITILKNEKTFEYYMCEHVKKRGELKGEIGYGWSTMKIRWCTTLLKANLFNKFKRGLNEECVVYIGIAYDEQKRIKNDKYPLVDLKMTEKDALKYCYDNGFNWGGLYENFKRVSCWCCPLKSLPELKELFINYPKLWEQLKKMDNLSPNKFRADYSVEELENKFKQTCLK